MTPLYLSNIDTDQKSPKQFLKLIQRTGSGKYLFYDWRFDRDGNPKLKFVLNDPMYTGRQTLLARIILVAGVPERNMLFGHIQNIMGFKQ